MSIKQLFWTTAAVPPPRAEAKHDVAISGNDPQIDQILIAFDAMHDTMPQQQLGVAIAATAKAIGAAPAALLDTIDKRLTALDTVVAAEQRKCAERQAARATELKTTTAAAHAEITTMENRIAALKQQLGSAAAAIQEQSTREHEAVAAFDQKVRGEAARLVALRSVLATEKKGLS